MIIVRDPLYGIIEVENEFLPLLDNPYFQRLRHIKQDALLFYVFPSAKHDRFSHSLGAYHLMRQVVENNSKMISKEDAFTLKAAALLHDIGHGPYSHTWEQLIDGFDHEAMTVKIINEEFNLPNVAAVVEKKHPLSSLLSSVIDVDKLDYMARDSYFCGVGYGYTDVERIVRYLSIQDGKLCISPKIFSSVEHVIMSRINLYNSTYFHHSVIVKDVLMKNIFKRAKELFLANETIFVDELFAKFLRGQGSVDDFLLLDDSVIEFHMNKWRLEEDEILADLVARFFSRKGFASANNLFDTVSPEAIKAKVSEVYDSAYYFADFTIKKGVYENEAYVVKSNGTLAPLSQLSEHIAGIVNIPIKKRFIIAPKEFLN
ncbi:HD domain-containing protein [Candidatus Woesearchaeota archaeon]|nr:HD domain-containing protein [Candidatus Woesearchaeota archaeon]